MTAVRQLRADAPLPDHSRLAPAHQRLLTEITSPRRGHAWWKLKAIGTAVAVVAAALLSTLTLRQETTTPAVPVPRPTQWVYQHVRLDTWQCGTTMTTYEYSETGFLNLAPTSQPCHMKSTKQVNTERWIRYDGEALAMPDRSTNDPNDVEVWKGRYQTGWDMLSPEDSDALVAALPDDPEAALTLIRKRSVPSRLASTARLTQAQRDFAEVVEILSGTPNLPPEKARTIMRIITGLKGASKPVRVTDGAGRAVLAIGINGHFRDYSYERNGMQVLLDARSLAYRGVRYIAGLDYYVGGRSSGGPFVAKGTVLATATRLSTGIVARAGLRP